MRTRVRIVAFVNLEPVPVVIWVLSSCSAIWDKGQNWNTERIGVLLKNFKDEREGSVKRVGRVKVAYVEIESFVV